MAKYPEDYYESGILDLFTPKIKDFGIVWPYLLFYSESSDSTALEPCDQGGYIPSPREWKEIRERVDLYYENLNAAVIAHHNFELNKKHGLLPAPTKPPKVETPRTLLSGYVYILAAENARYKIGRAKNLANRLKSLRTASPVQFTLTHSIQSVDTVRAESLLHHYFADKRSHGEWFNLASEDLDWIRNLGDFALDRGSLNVETANQ